MSCYVHSISCELEWKRCCRWRISGCLAENPLVGASATSALHPAHCGSSELVHSHPTCPASHVWETTVPILSIYLIWHENGSKESFLKKTMCHEGPSRPLNAPKRSTCQFSPDGLICLGIWAVGTRRAKVWYRQQNVSVLRWMLQSSTIYDHPGHMEVWASMPVVLQPFWPPQRWACGRRDCIM